MVARLILAVLCASVLLAGCGEEPKRKKKKKSAASRSEMPANKVFGGKLVRALVGELKSSDSSKRADACRSLGNQYGGAKAALPALKKLKSSDKSKEVREAAAEAIKKIESNS